MQTFSQYMSESISVEDLPQSLVIGKFSGNAASYGGFTGAVATIQQKQAKRDQSLFPVGAYDVKEFGKLLKSNDTMCRISTTLSSNAHDQHRTICFINVKAGTIRFVDNDKYEHDGKIVSTRPMKFNWLNVDPSSLNYFKITGEPTEDSQNPFRTHK
jgi:hypothetical protein